MSKARRNFGSINVVGKAILGAEIVYGDMSYNENYSRRKFVTHKHLSAKQLTEFQAILQLVVPRGWHVELINWTNLGDRIMGGGSYKCVVAKLRRRCI